MPDSTSDFYKNLLSRAASSPMSELLPSTLILAREINNRRLERWVRLEMGGYYDDNPAMAKDVRVPDYRAVPGIHLDRLGRPLNLPSDWTFLNKYFLREGVSELERFAGESGTLKVSNPKVNESIRNNLKVEVHEFSFNTTSVVGVLSNVRAKLLDWLHEIRHSVESHTSSLPAKERFNETPEPLDRSRGMRVFIGWSGDLSNRVAIVLRDWLPTVLPFVDAWVSSKDLRKGERWMQRLSRQLDETSFGIPCLVPGNLTSEWLNFEAGALAKRVDDSYMSPFLLGVSPADLGDGPLGQFQHTIYDNEDMRKLAYSINAIMRGGQMSEKEIDQNFDNCWPGLKAKLDTLLGEAQAKPQAAGPRSTQPAGPSLDPRAVAILKQIADNGDEGYSAYDLADPRHLRVAECQYLLDQLEDNFLLERGPGREVGEVAYHLTKEGRKFLFGQPKPEG